MISALEQACITWPQDTLRVEHFVSSVGTLDAAKEHAFEVELKASGMVLPVRADQTLLSALRAANIDMESD